MLIASIFLVVYLVSPGYNTTFNATEYEFDMNVLSPVGTVVFKVLLITENMIDISVTIVHFAGNEDSFGPFSHNFNTQGILTVTVEEALDPNDNTTDYYFDIDYEAYSPFIEGTREVYTDSANVILHEQIGKL